MQSLRSTKIFHSKLQIYEHVQKFVYFCWSFTQRSHPSFPKKTLTYSILRLILNEHLLCNCKPLRFEPLLKLCLQHIFLPNSFKVKRGCSSWNLRKQRKFLYCLIMAAPRENWAYKIHIFLPLTTCTYSILNLIQIQNSKDTKHLYLLKFKKSIYLENNQISKSIKIKITWVKARIFQFSPR